MTRNGQKSPIMAKNDPIDHSRPKMAPKTAENGQKWSKMADNGR